nr:MAG TPA: YopX protein [Caudoviricetes sp.]
MVNCLIVNFQKRIEFINECDWSTVKARIYENPGLLEEE